MSDPGSGDTYRSAIPASPMNMGGLAFHPIIHFLYFYTNLYVFNRLYLLKTLLLSFLILRTASFGFSQDQSNPEEAFRISAETKKPILLIFSGSDWCALCIRFEKKILSEDAFQEYAKEHLVILKADFPQRKKIPEKLREQNDALAEQYNPTGLFPHLVLLRKDQSKLTTLVYSNQGPTEFISEINAVLPNE